jgi:hypothetical protein
VIFPSTGFNFLLWVNQKSNINILKPEIMPIQQQQKKVKGVADIVFCIDATGSMQTVIDSVKDNIDHFVHSLKDLSANMPIDWQARVIGYRDFSCDTEYLIDKFGFVTSADDIKSQLDQIVADGGGDEPESTLDVIAIAAKKSAWRTTLAHKTIVVFTDATPRDIDPKSSTDTGITDIALLKQVMIENHIKLFLYGQQCPQYDELKDLPKASINLFADAITELPKVDFKALLDQIGKTVTNVASTPLVL